MGFLAKEDQECASHFDRSKTKEHMITSKDMARITRALYVLEALEGEANRLFDGELSDALRTPDDRIVDGYRKALRFCLKNKKEFLNDNLCY